MNSGTEEKDASFVNFLLGDFQSKEEPSRFDISFLLGPGLVFFWTLGSLFLVHQVANQFGLQTRAAVAPYMLHLLLIECN